MDRRRFLLISLVATLAPVGAEAHADGCAAAREKKPREAAG
jgi:hypothetical protein